MYLQKTIQKIRKHKLQRWHKTGPAISDKQFRIYIVLVSMYEAAAPTADALAVTRGLVTRSEMLEVRLGGAVGVIVGVVGREVEWSKKPLSPICSPAPSAEGRLAAGNTLLLNS